MGEAEAAAFGGTDLETQLPIEDLVTRAAAVLSSSWWALAGGPAVRVTAGRASARSSSARSGPAVTIRLAPGQRDLISLAHELAHALAGVDRGHDQRFRTALVDVVAVLTRPAAGAALAHAFDSFELDRDPRHWPPPARLEGDSFLVL